MTNQISEDLGKTADVQFPLNPASLHQVDLATSHNREGFIENSGVRIFTKTVRFALWNGLIHLGATRRMFSCLLSNIDASTIWKLH